MAATPQCQQCERAPAQSICSCSVPPTPLCLLCLTLHSSAQPFEVHTLFPVSALRWLSTPGYLVRLQHRRESSSRAVEELTANVKRLDYCQTVFEQRVEQAVEALQMYREQTVAMLGRYKRELEEAAKVAQEEASEHIFDEKYSAENTITAAILDYCPGKLTLFTYEMTAEGRLLPKLAPLPKPISSPSDSPEPSSLLPPTPEVVFLPPETTEEEQEDTSLAVIEETPESCPIPEEEKVDFEPVEETEKEELEGPLSLPSPTLIAKPQICVSPTHQLTGSTEESSDFAQLKSAALSPAVQHPPGSLSLAVHVSVQQASESFEEPNSALIPPPLIASVSSLALAATSWTPLPYKITKESMTFLTLASSPTQRELRYSTKVPLTRHSAMAVVTQDSLLICGGDDPLTDTAVSLNFNSGAITHLRHMNVPRFAHGIAVYGACVYVFGGKNGSSSITAAERYRRKGKDWEQLPQMLTARSFFNPCVVGQVVFIVGGADTCKSETFDIVGMRFTELKLNLPVPGATSVLTLDDDLVILQTGKASRVKANLKGAVQVYELVNGNRSPWGNLAPLLLGSDILVGQCFSDQVLHIDSLAWSAHIYS